LTLKVLSESRVTWDLCANFSLPRPLSVLELSPMYVTDRERSDRRQTKASLNAPAFTRGGGIITEEAQ